MLRLSGWIDGLNRRIGRLTAWFALGLVLVEFTVVVLRYVFGLGFIPLQELAVYQHALMFTVGAGLTLLLDGHVRVDILYGSWSARRRALVDLFGTLFFLWPVCAVVWVYSWPYVAQSWRILEGSREASGLPLVYILKTGVLAFAVVLALQGASLAIRSWMRLSCADAQTD